MLKPLVVPIVLTQLLIVGFVENALCQSSTVPNEIRAIKDYWVTEGYGAVIAIDACEDQSDAVCGRLVWAWEPADLAPGSLGKVILTGARYDGTQWRGARLTNPDDGRSYRGRLEIIDENRLRLEGCALFICRDQIWWRLNRLPHVCSRVEPVEGCVESSMQSVTQD